MHVSEKITNILNYYSGNPGCDPNMYEYVEVCYDLLRYLNQEAPDYGIHKDSEREKYPIACAIYDKFRILSQQLEEKLLVNNLGVTEESLLYKLYKDSTYRASSYGGCSDYEVELYKKLGGVSLYIAQEKRNNPDYRYDNVTEMAYMQELATTLAKTNPNVLIQNQTNKPNIAQQLLDDIANEMTKSKSV